MRIFFICFLISLRGASCFSQEKDPEDIIIKLLEPYNQIENFKARVNIDVNVDFILIPVKSAIVYFMKPNFYRMESDEFFMVPKKGIGFPVFELFNSDYKAIFMGERVIENRKMGEIKIIPINAKTDVVLATLYYDLGTYLIHHSELDTRNAGFFITDFFYGDATPLPDSIRVKFEVSEFRLPLRFMGKVNVDHSKVRDEKMGEVILRYSEFDVNREMDHSLFTEEDYN